MLTTISKYLGKYAFVITLFSVMWIVACTTTNSEANVINEVAETLPAIVKVETEYVTMPYEEMISQADAIVIGIVKHISNSQWNQADGKYWEETTIEGENEVTLHTASLFHEIELTVEQTVADNIGLSSDNIIITELGKSPVDESTVIIEGTEYQNDLYQLSVGDEIIVFLARGEMAFRDPDKAISLAQTEDGITYFDVGVREIIGFLVKPDESFFLKGEDGLYYNSNLREQPLSLENFTQDVSNVRGTN